MGGSAGPAVTTLRRIYTLGTDVKWGQFVHNLRDVLVVFPSPRGTSIVPNGVCDRACNRVRQCVPKNRQQAPGSPKEDLLLTVLP